MNRFYVEIRNADNKVERVESGFATREDAERIADARRREVSNRGWAHKVYVGEAHEVR